ncbi:GcvT family protein [Nitriliruptor alkaliphilus]|uniref:GcvT family protein n=1 Tax=Nitriliruptor alkaliphilus TaxID=427918 RepID=UPI0006982233|nr:FAD-dependent oxidoreductase [Nitriliruptor alkaliphilus]
MSDLPEDANVVVIGAGIVGNSLVGHLADLGWRDIVLLDKGPLPDPGGSTGHASNFIFPVDHSKEFALLTLDSQRQYEQMGVNTTCGGIEVARTPERMEELRRRMASAKAWGVESELIGPKEVAELVPFINTDIILGGFHTPSVSVVDSLQAGTLMRQRALDAGALTISPWTEVEDIEVDRGRVKAVVTDKGRIRCDYVVIACGVWSPRIAAMAGASIPLTPAVHQMIDVGPIPLLEATRKEIAFPIVRDVDTNMYERQNGGDMEVGSYAHRAILHHPNEIPSIAEAQLSPTQMPFTAEDFDQQMEDALELMPEILDVPGAGIKHAINGLLSLTPDGGPLLGETVEVKGLWSAAAVWIKEGPSVGRAIAEWMTDGQPEYDLHGGDIARFAPNQRTAHHIRARTSEGFNKTYGIVHPREQWASNRGARLAPFHRRTEALGAVYFEAGGWERPQWYGSNAPLLEEFADRIPQREHEWDARWWSPIINVEHLAMRERVAMIDLTAFSIFEVTGPGAVDYLQRMTVANMDRPPGRIMYTPVLNQRGGFRSDLTVVRLGPDHFRIITGGADWGRDLKWFRDHLPEDGSAHLTDATNAWTTIGVWGPRARDLVSSVTEDMSDEAFPFGSAQWREINGVPALLVRISYVGELGWEIHAPIEQGERLWDTLFEAGQPLGCIPAGAGVYGTTGRLEKGYRLMGAELESEFNPVEAGLALPKVKSADFIGKEAYLAAREEEPAAILCTLTVEDHTSASGILRYPQGGEPILTLGGGRIVDRHGRPSYVTTAGSGPSVGKHLLLSYLPPELAVEGTDLLVEYMGERYPVKVAVAGRTPLFDPDDSRMKA